MLNTQKPLNVELFTLKGNKVTVYESESGLGLGLVTVEKEGKILPFSGMTVQFCEGEKLAGEPIFKDCDIDVNFTYDAFSDRKLKSIILDKESTIRYRQYLNQQHQAKRAETYAKIQAEQAAIESKIKGLATLKRAYAEWALYREKFNAAMENEQQDGVNMPARPDVEIDDLEKQYPSAKVYLEAEKFSDSMHTERSEVGKEAKSMLLNGESPDVVENFLKNWHKKENPYTLLD